MYFESAKKWSEVEFGTAQLGDVRRVRRLQAVAAAVAQKPAGRITDVMQHSAQREGAYRLIENDAVDAEQIGAASASATFTRAAKLPFLFVPLDGSSLAITDKTGRKGFGLIGARKLQSTGVQVMSAIGVDPDGVPVGLLWQHYWSRTKRSTRPAKNDRRLFAEKETRFWIDGMKAVHAYQQQNESTTPLWFQLDRGGDAGEVLFAGLSEESWFTVRAAYNRRLASDPDEQRQYLRDQAERAEIVCTYELPVKARPHRQGRTAQMVIRVAPVEIRITNSRGKNVRNVAAWTVLAHEQGTTPEGEKPLDWLLITNRPVTSAEEAQQVLHGYACRWRIEEFHKAWKTGACKIEDSQLESFEALTRYARITAAVAVRVVRISYLARQQPERPATSELSDNELQAMRAWHEHQASEQKSRKGGKSSLKLDTLGDAVNYIAQLGGYTGKSSGGPPGFITISRGLQFLEVLAFGYQMGRGQM